MSLRPRIASNIVNIIGRLRDAGFETYVVGGAVRDFLRGRSPKDYDLSTSATPYQIRQVFGRRRTFLIGRRFRLVHLHDGREIIEISTFRRAPGEKGNHSNRKSEDSPENMIFRDNVYGSSEEDAWRRDFTVNAIFYDPIDDNLVDYTGMGIDDVNSGIVRCIGDAKVRFEEDPVRVLRALKLVGQYDFELEQGTREAVGGALELISHVPHSRLTLELEKVMKNPYGDRILRAFQEYGFLNHYLPNLAKGWSAPTGKYMMDLLMKRNERVCEGLYRDSVSLAIAAISLPFIEGHLGGNVGELWDNRLALESELRNVITWLFHPHHFSKRLMVSVLRMLLIQPKLLSKNKSLRVLRNPAYPHGRELMILQNETRWKDPELTELWPKRSYSGTGRRRKRRRRRN